MPNFATFLEIGWPLPKFCASGLKIDPKWQPKDAPIVPNGDPEEAKSEEN